MIVVDAHEDLAWNILTFGRDPFRSVEETRRGEVGSAAVTQNGEATVGWPEWMAARVAVVFATLFAAPQVSPWGVSGAHGYSTPEEAHGMYRAQLDLYHRLVAEHPDRLALIGSRADLDGVLATWEGDGPRRVGLVVLMEGADGIREPGEVDEWLDAGVRLIGPSWTGTRYAGGTGVPGPFSAAGRDLLRRMEARGTILDLSHLSDEATMEALDVYGGPIVATHANARALLPSFIAPERHLSDDAIRRLVARDGIIGVVLLNAFLRDGTPRDAPKESVTLADVVAHVDHICQLAGDTDHVGIGSDFDGGFGRSRLPAELDSVADLPRIGEALAARGYSDAQVQGIMGGNWLRFLRRALPGS